MFDFGFIEGAEVVKLDEYFLFALLHNGLRVEPLGGTPQEVKDLLDPAKFTGELG